MDIRNAVVSFLNTQLGANFSSIQDISSNNKYYYRINENSFLDDKFLLTGWARVHVSLIVDVRNGNTGILQNIVHNENIMIISLGMIDDGQYFNIDTYFEIELEKTKQKEILKVAEVGVEVINAAEE